MPFLLDEDADSVTKARKLMRSGEFDRCIELLDQLPQDISIVFLRARVLLRQGRHADAIDILSPVREHANPLQQPELQMLLGAAHAYKGELLPARDYLAASAEGMSEFDPLRFELAYHSG
ncbi:MAG: tetratricopeptide repeat protein, partial [Candidatus Eremiobacteraeota bacterium]|nr:tetratricopeptide repeat protein [Candidatus Eremiobacteraeota bacterium]